MPTQLALVLRHSFTGPLAIYWISKNPVASHLFNTSDRTIDTLLMGSAGLAVEAHERAFANEDVLAVDAPVAGAADDDRDLLLAGVRLVVLASLDVRSELEPVDAERLYAERPAHEAHRTAGPEPSSSSTFTTE